MKQSDFYHQLYGELVKLVLLGQTPHQISREQLNRQLQCFNKKLALLNEKNAALMVHQQQPGETLNEKITRKCY